MKYEFLVKEKFKNSSDEIDNEKHIENNNKSFIGSTMLSTYEDFNIFIKKTNENSSNEVSNKKEENINNIDSKNSLKNKDIKNDIKYDNSTYFESEKKTVETIVKYSSSLINFLLKFVYILKNAFMNLISKKKINNNTIKNKEIIDKFNKHIKKKLVNNDHKYKVSKHIERKEDKNVERKEDKNVEKKVERKEEKKVEKHIERREDRHIKKINSYLLELE